MTSTKSSLTLNDTVPIDMDKEYNLLVMSNIGDMVTKNFLWTEVVQKNFSQLPYQLVGVGYKRKWLDNYSSL